MKVSKKDIQNINRTRSARKGRIYSSFDGNTYVGQDNGTLLPQGKSIKDKQADRALEARVTTNEEDIDKLEETKDDIVDVDAKLKALECKLLAFNIVMG